MTRGLALTAVTVALALGTLLAAAPQRANAAMRGPAAKVTRAVNIPSPVCTVAGWFSGLAGTLCSVARKGGELLGAGGKLFGATGTAAKVVSVAAVLAGLTAWVAGAGHAVLTATAAVIGTTTRPQLESSWFSASYWRMAEIGLLLTVPFLFAACVQGILRSDPSLIGRAALGYLPLAVLGISIAAPLTTLLLSASDGLSMLIADAAGEAPGATLAKLGLDTGAVAGVSGSTFIAFVIGFVTVAATLTLWVELLIRAAAVSVIVLMLPVVFAALVWPARRVWAIRSVETLVALILAKFAIVAVLSLGGAALGRGFTAGPAAPLVGVTLVMLAAFSPWALLRLLPLHELAAGVEGLGSPIRPRISMPAGPAPQGAVDEPARPAASLPEDGTADAARMVVGGLNGGGGPDGRVFPDEAPAGTAVNGGHEPMTGSGGPVRPTEADRVAEAANAAGTSETAAGLGSAAGALGGTAGVQTGAGAPPPLSGAPDHGDHDHIERLPGMAPMWQRKNGTWPVHVLGPEVVTPGPEPVPETAVPPVPPEAPLGPVDPPGSPDAPAGGQR